MRRILILLALLIALPVWASAAPEHFVLVRYSGPDPDKYRASLVALVSGESIGLRTLISALPADASDADILKEARRFGCDVILTVTVTPADDKDQVVWSLSSPDEKRPRASGKLTKPRPILGVPGRAIDQGDGPRRPPVAAAPGGRAGLVHRAGTPRNRGLGTARTAHGG
jgi:hypothetical protein